MALPAHNYVVHEETIEGIATPLIFSPFSVEDKKNLLAAVSFKDAKAFIRTVVDIVERKTNLKEISPGMPLHMIEVAFIRVYSKSMGGTIDATFTCQAPVVIKGEDGNDDTEGTCNHPTEIHIPIDDVQIDWGGMTPGKNHIVKLTGGEVFVELAMPPWDVMKAFVGEGGAAIDINDKFVLACIRSVGTPVQTYTREDFTEEELEKWVNDLSSQDGDLLMPFFSNLPVISKSFDVKCPKCDASRTIVLRGLDDFFV